MKKYKYYVRSKSANDLTIRDWETDRKRYMTIRKYLIKEKGMHEDYCSKSGTKFIAGDQGILIFRTEVK